MTTNVNMTSTPRDMSGRKAIAGLFETREEAERAIDELKALGIRGDQIGVAMHDKAAQGELAQETGTKAAEGATSGAVGGGLLGGVLGFLVGAGALAIPGVGPVIAGGMLASALGVAGGTAVAGAGIGAAAGGITGALVGMGIPDEEAKHFEGGFKSGGILVTVGGGRTMEALAVLERNGGDTGPGSTGATARASRATRGAGAGTATGALGGAAAGAAAGTVVAGPVGTVVGGVAGAAGGAAAGKDAADEQRRPRP